MATIALTYDTVAVGYDYATGSYNAASLQTEPSSMSPVATSAATITPV